MIDTDANQAAKLAELRAMQSAGNNPRVAELVLVEWPMPDGPIYYATRLAADLVDSETVLDQLDGPIELRLGRGVFLDAAHEAGIGDDTIPLDFWDGDHELTRLLITHGAGVRAELFYYFPDVDLFVSEWWGHVQPPEAINIDRVMTVAAAGFRSSGLPLPGRAFFTGCQAVFGGLLDTQAEIDEGDCPYNRHLYSSGGTGWLYARPLTVDHTKIPNTDLVNFAFPVVGTYPYLATEANGGRVKNASGHDVAFFTDETLTTKLSHEVVSYNASTGAVVYWVKLPTASHTLDTVIYLAYGNAGITTAQSDGPGVWDAALKGVYHFNGTPPSGLDSTSNVHHATVNGATATAGKVGGGAHFTAGQNIMLPASADFIFGSGDCTISFWFKPENIGTLAIMIGKDHESSRQWIICHNAAGNTLGIVLYGPPNSSTNTISTLVNGTWYMGHLTRSGSTLRLYLNGVLDGPTTSTTLNLTGTRNVFLGKREYTTNPENFTGSLDEVRFAKGTARSADWIKAEFNSQNSPATFYAIGAEFAAQPVFAFGPPSWINVANGTPGANGAFLKTGVVNAWDCGAAHAVAVEPGTDASMRFKFAAGYTAAGFFSTDTPRSGGADCWAVLQANLDHNVSCKYLGTNVQANVATWAASDSFEIKQRDGVFYFYKNATEIMADFKLPPPPAVDPLHLGVAIQNPGAGLSSSAVLVGDAGPAPAFGLLDPATGLPFTSCPRNTPAVCAARLGDSLSYLAFDTVAESHVVNETRGPNITVTSRGNETNLKRPLRVIAGRRHVFDLDLLAFVVEPNTKHPDEGSVKCLFAACEGPLNSITNGKINGNTIAPQHYNYRNGEKRQGQTSFSPNILNYSGTALFLGVAQGDFTKSGAEDLRGEADVEGLRNVRVYSDALVYHEQFSTERGWWLLHCLRNKRWGYGLDAARVEIQDFIDLALWCNEVVGQKDKEGHDTTGPRTQFNAELIERTAQQQITDICSSGRFGLPFTDRGKLRVLPLRRADELFSPYVFTDQAFWSVLVRPPTSAEGNAWVEALNTARAVSNAALWAEGQARQLELFHSAEYTARARTDAEFVTDCYHSYLRRPPDAAGLAFWVGQVALDGRDAVLAAFNASGEFEDLCADHPIATFSDRGADRNICFDEARTTLEFSMQSDAELVNRIVLTFDDQTQENTQIPLTFENVTQQLRAGQAFGDTSRRAVERPYTAFGITSIGEAGRLGNLLLDLGEFDEGGVANNLRAEFVTWYLAAVELHKYQIIKIESDKLDQINAARTAQGLEAFDYFRIRSLKRSNDLTVEISAQAYPVLYYDRLELLNHGPVLPPTLPGEGGFDPEDPDGPGRGRLPFNVTLIALSHNDDQLFFTVGKEAI